MTMAETTEKMHVLLADDSRVNLLSMSRALSVLDIEIVTAGSGQETLDRAGQHDYALILLDVHMPDLDGIAVARALSQREDTRHIPLIFITATEDDERQLLEGYDVGAVDYLIKPVHPHVLRSKVNVFCRLKEQTGIIARHMSQLEQEIRERGQVEAQLRHSEMRYRVLSDLSPVAVCVEVEGCLQYANRAMCDLLGIDSVDHLAQLSLASFVEPASRREFDQFRQTILQLKTSEHHLETALLRADGLTVPVELRGAPIPFEEGFGVQLAAQDITARKESEEHLRLRASVDGLTGIANRRAFDEYLEKEWGRGLREQLPMSIAIVDVDFFKAYNDHHGHPAGDLCLQRVATCLEGAAQRSSDLVARYGGEEFASVLPNTTGKGAFRVVEAMRRNIADLGLSHGFSDASPNVSVSIGVATAVPKIGASARSLVQCADEALYRAKGLGRNRIEVAVVKALKETQ